MSVLVHYILTIETIKTVSLETTVTQKELGNKLGKEEREEINATVRKSDEINQKHLQQRKNKRFTYLKFKPTRSVSETTEFKRESLIPIKTDNSGEKKTYANIVFRRVQLHRYPEKTKKTKSYRN